MDENSGWRQKLSILLGFWTVIDKTNCQKIDVTFSWLGHKSFENWTTAEAGTQKSLKIDREMDRRAVLRKQSLVQRDQGSLQQLRMTKKLNLIPLSKMFHVTKFTRDYATLHINRVRRCQEFLSSGYSENDSTSFWGNRTIICYISVSV